MQVFYYERRVCKKLSASSYEKYETFLTTKGIISFTIPRMSIFLICFYFLQFSKYCNQILNKDLFLVIIIILICRTLPLSIIIPFNILEFSSNKKLEKEKLNKNSSLFKKLLELHLLPGVL